MCRLTATLLAVLLTIGTSQAVSAQDGLAPSTEPAVVTPADSMMSPTTQPMAPMMPMEPVVQVPTDPMVPSVQPSTEPSAVKLEKVARLNIVDTLRSRGNYTKIVKLIESSGYEDTLKSRGLTFFAPTDEAFANMTQASLDDMMMPGNRDNLRMVLLTHTVVGRRSKATLFTTFVKNMLGKKVHVTWIAKTITLDGKAVIVEPNLKAGNGYVHGINAVLQPR